MREWGSKRREDPPQKWVEWAGGLAAMLMFAAVLWSAFSLI